jgi:hypothetical protein
MTKPVTDPALIQLLESEAAGPKPVTDPDLLKQLDEGTAEGGGVSDIAMGALRGINKGLVGMATAPYRLLDWGIEQATGGDGLPDADKMSLYKSYLSPPEPQDAAARLAQAAGEGVGASILPTGAVLGASQKLAALVPNTLPRAVGQAVGKPFAANPGAAVAADAVASSGAGIAQQAARDEGVGPAGQIAAGLAGAAAPAVGLAGLGKLGGAAQPYISPAMARWKAELDALRHKHGLHFSADGGLPPNVGAQAAADQVLANQLMRAGRSVDDIRRLRAEADEATRFHTSGRAQNALSLAEADESLQRLAGSAVRASPEAGNRAKGFLEGRQTGITPAAGMPEGSGVPTRALLSKPMTGAQAEKELGSRFNTPENKIVPMGQGERVTDAFKRALLLEDEVHHGHGANAYQTKKAIQGGLEEEAKKLYPKAWASAEDFDLSKAFQNLQAKKAEINDARVERFFDRLERLFTRKTGNGAPLSDASELQRFDLAKQRLDGLIDDFKGKDSFIYRALVQFKHDLLDGVHGGDRLNPARNKSYADARDFYTTEKRAQETIDLGKSVFREESNIGVDAFRSLETKADQKLFRLGLLGGAEEAVARMGRGHDATKIFDSKRIQDLLAEVIPRTETKTGRVKMVDGKPAEFSNRPERFGKYIQGAKEEVRTREIVRGGSPTQRNRVDDEAFEIKTKLSQAIEHLKAGSLTMAGAKYASHLAEKIFGMRADTSAALARSLFTANDMEIALILARVEARMGRDRLTHFTRMLEQYQAAIAPAGLSGTATSGGTAQ